MSADPAGFDLINPMEWNDQNQLVAKQHYAIIEATNWYSYVSNNPIKYVDPSGESGVLILVGIMLSLVIGGSVSKTISDNTGYSYFRSSGQNYTHGAAMLLLTNPSSAMDGAGVITSQNSRGQSNSRFSVTGKADAIVSLGGMLAIGMGDSAADATCGTIENAANGTATVDFQLWIEVKGHGRNRRVTDWGVNVPGPNTDPNATTFFGDYFVPVEDRDRARELINQRPDLLKDVLQQAGIVNEE